MDFIYQLDGIATARRQRSRCASTTRRATSSSTPPHCTSRSKLGLSETIFGDAFASSGTTVDARHSEADDPVAEHGPLPRRPRGDRRGRLPRHRSSSGPTSSPPTARRCGGSTTLGCAYLQFDDTSLAYLNDPEQRRYVESIGGDPERQHLEYIRAHQRGARRPARRDGVTTHMCRGNFRSSWVAEGGYDFVAEALFNELDVDGFFMEWDDGRSGGFEPLRFLPQGAQAGRARARDDEARRAGAEGRAEAAHRGGVPVRAARPALPLAAVRLLLDGRGQRADARGAGREAPPDRRDGRGDLGD